MIPTPRASRAPGANRVPEPGAAFWVIKILTTGMGETTSDFLVKTFPPELVVPVTSLVLLVVLAMQLRSRVYQPARYWITVLMVSIFGTMAADVLHVGAGVPYAISTVGFAVVLVAVFTAWWSTERTLSVHDIRTDRRERFYWASVITTFALGTAVGDLTANALGLGYLRSGFLFLVLFSLPGLFFLITRRGAVPAFWIAYVLTRPLGASFADWSAVSHARGGLDLGTGPVSGGLLIVFVVLVGLLVARTRSGRGRDRSGAAGARGVA